MDKRGRDQFVIRHQEETEIYWNDGKKMQAIQVLINFNLKY